MQLTAAVANQRGLLWVLKHPPPGQRNSQFVKIIKINYLFSLTPKNSNNTKHRHYLFIYFTCRLCGYILFLTWVLLWFQISPVHRRPQDLYRRVKGAIFLRLHPQPSRAYVSGLNMYQQSQPDCTWSKYIVKPAGGTVTVSIKFFTKSQTVVHCDNTNSQNTFGS